jgi:all-trans-retinol 13,14-reductase
MSKDLRGKLRLRCPAYMSRFLPPRILTFSAVTGKSTIEVITFVPYAVFAGWENTHWKRRGDEYAAMKQRMSARLRVELEKQVPSIIGNIAYAELSTPVTTRHFMNYGSGEIYGIAATPERFGLRELGARTPISGLYLTGQDVANLGVSGALFGGVISASVALRKNLFRAVSKPWAGQHASLRCPTVK